MSGMFDDFKEQVRSQANIVEIISEYVPLKKRGGSFWGCCPFHGEKTPSFSVTPDKNFFYCYGCHVGGDVFTFVMKMENCTFPEALKLLANKLGIAVPEKEKTKAELEREKQAKQVIAANELATRFFQACLTKTDYGIKAQEYLTGRGITPEIIERFSIGVALPNYNALLSALGKRGCSAGLLVQAGLAVNYDRGPMDKFRGRVMIPIQDPRGHVVGFGGRILEQNSQQMAKYMNTGETEWFNKRTLLFGMNVALKEIKKRRQAVIVEGYMDAIALHSHNITNAVASLGTAFTAQQCRKILRYSPNIYFCYDSDNAGQAATMRALAIASSNGANVKVITIPDGKDPDEFLRHHGSKEFYALIDKALPLMEYQLQYVLKSTDRNTLEGKLLAVNQLMPLLANITNTVERNEYIIRISNVLGIDEGVIRSDLQRQNSQRNFNAYDVSTDNLPGINSRKAFSEKKDALTMAGRCIIKKIWHEASILDYVLNLIPAEEFPNKIHGEILKYLANTLANNQPFTDIDAAEKLSDTAYSELSHCLVEEFTTDDDIQLTEDCLKLLRRYYLNSNYEKHRLLADELQRNGDSRFLEELKISQQIRMEMDNLSS